MRPVVIAALLVACTPEQPDEDAHVCDHLTEETMAITAVAAIGDVDAASTLRVEHDPYEVTLVDGASGFLGVDPGDHESVTLWVGTADVVQTGYLDGTEWPIDSAGANEHCAGDIPEHFDLEFGSGAWGIEVGPAAVDTVWIQVSEGHEPEE
jgi:hypothetical protein